MSDLSLDSRWIELRARIFGAPWHDWAHAYGPADDVPELLEALAVGSEEERKGAFYELYGNVFHQGTRWHASPRAVPFLLEMLALPLPDRAWLIEYLVSLALGYDEQFLPAGIDPEAEFAGADEQDEQDAKSCYDEDHLQGAEFARYATFARDTYRAVERGCDTFLSLLGDADLRVRLAAAYALAWFPSRAEDASRALLGLWDAMGEAEQANSLLAISLLGPRLEGSERARWLARADATLDLGGAVGKFGAAMALSNWSAVAGEAWDNRALQVLAGAVSGEDLGAWQQEQAPQGTGLAWHSGDLPALAAARLADVPGAAREQAMRSLRQALPGAPPITSLSLTNTLLALAFAPDEDGERPAIKRESLTSEQESALRAIAEHGAWRVGDGHFANYSSLVRAFGLPGDQDALRAWL